MLQIPQILTKIFNDIIKHDALPIIIGGYVRDSFLSIPSKDIDIEVYYLKNIELLIDILSPYGKVDMVGKQFGIIKLIVKNLEYDFSFPRTENKIGIGHRGFNIQIDNNIDFKTASLRRDFTINSIGYDYKNKTFLDPFDGIKDLKNKLLKHINTKTFQEDPLRVYRGVQFCSRFNLTLEKETEKLFFKMIKLDDFKTISKERISQEFDKMLLKSAQPFIGLKLLDELKLADISNLDIKTIDEIALFEIEQKDKIILFYSLLQDIIKDFSINKKYIKQARILNNFIIPKIYLYKLKNITSKSQKLLITLQIKNNMPKPIVTGKDLIDLGLKPSPKFKIILDKFYQMQLDGLLIDKVNLLKLL